MIFNSNLIIKRPGTGVSPIHMESFLKKKSSRNIKRDEILTWNDIE